MAGLAILKSMQNLSDESLCERWLENPYYQLFCGKEFFQHRDVVIAKNCRKLSSKQPRNVHSGGWPQLCILLSQRCFLWNGMAKPTER